MMMKRFYLILAALLCMSSLSHAYEYVFDWSQLSIDNGSGSGDVVYPPTPTDGIDLYVRAMNGDNPISSQQCSLYVYAWLDDGTELLGSFPGTQLTDEKQIAKVGDLENTKSFFKVHFNYPKVNVKISNNGEYKTSDIKLGKSGAYFLDYKMYQSELSQLSDYYSGSSDVDYSKTNIYGPIIIYTRVMDDVDFTPYIYYWLTWSTPDWNNSNSHHAMETVYIYGQKWYKYTITDGNYQQAKFIINKDRSSDYQTTDISVARGGNHFYWFYPNGYGDKYEHADFIAGPNNYAEISGGSSDPNAEDEVAFTVEGEHGTATLTIHCKHSLIDKVKIVNGELQFPRYSWFEVRVDDGYNLNRVWLGRPNQGNTSYQFGDKQSLKPCDGNTDVTDMGMNNELWQGNHDDHLYNISNGSNIVVSGYVNDWDEVYYMSPKVRVYSEGTSLERLVDAHWGVRQLNQAFDHDLVGVQARDNGNQTVLICRSVDYVANHNPIKEGQKSIINPKTGKPFEWSDPNTKQYAWIALQLPEGQNPKDFEGKQLRGIRGAYCTVTTPAWHIEWYNPTMIVDEITADQVVAEGVETHFNTYTVANLTDQSYRHVYDDSEAWKNPADRPNENGVKSFDISGDYYFIVPRRWEICNLTNVMRTDDEVIYIPDSRAIMPTDITVDEDGNIISEVIRPNYFDQNDVEGYANIQRPYEVGEKSIWNKADTISLGVDHLGEKWRMRYMTYDIPEALVFASDFHPNDYPLSVPDRTYDIELAKKGNIGMHIIGVPELNRYEKDILISASDYWSRYKYSTDVNVYRNDLHIAPNTLKESFGNTGNLVVYREEYRGEEYVRSVEIARIIQKGSTSFKASGANRVEYQLQYLNLDEDNAARHDDLLKNEAQESDGTKFIPIPVTIAVADTTCDATGLVQKTFVIGEGSSDHYVNVYDMFYSYAMEDLATNESLPTDYYYRVKPESENQPNLEEVSGYAPIYKTNVNVVNHAIYDLESVENDKKNELAVTDEVLMNFTPNQDVPVTEYRVYSGTYTESNSDLTIIEESEEIVVGADKFLQTPLKMQSGIVHVPEAYTDYNYNTYGCYKQRVGDARVTVNTKNVAQSETDFYRDLGEDGLVDKSIVSKLYHVDILGLTGLTLPNDESRYLLRVWRQVNDEDMVLLNDIEKEFVLPKDDIELLDEQNNPIDLSTFYNEMDEYVKGQSGEEASYSFSDTFYHNPLDESDKVTYYVTLYVQEPNTGKYYVKKVEIPVSLTDMGVITGLDELLGDDVTSVTYINISGQAANSPFDGVNVVVTRHSDGRTTARKVLLNSSK